MLLDERLEVLIDPEFGLALAAGAGNVLSPEAQHGPTLLDRNRFIVGYVVHFPAKCVEGGHSFPLGFGKKDKGKGQIRGALARDSPAVLHRLLLCHLGGRLFRPDGRQPSCFSQRRIARQIIGMAPAFSAHFRWR